ncbi:MAG: glycosyltransferase family 39 protein [Candidatus Coatesbacteria bacterium]|nr:glycosyltransferase family 39 protein [Candidatus Coatesbacteria bacterium]
MTNYIKDRRIVWLFVAALVVRLFLVFIHTDVKLVHEMNGYNYAARSMLAGKGFVCVEDRGYRAFLPPGYSFFQAGIYWLFGHSLFAARFIQAILGALTVVFTYILARYMFEDKVAMLGAWILAFYPQSVQFADLMQTETVFLFFFMLAMIFFFQSLESADWRAILTAGILLGISALVRSIIMFYVPLIIGFLIIFKRDRRMIKTTVIVLLLMAAVILPWTIRNYVLLDAFIPINTKAGWDFFQHNHSDMYYIMRNLSDEPGEDEADRLAMDENGHTDEVKLSQVCQKLALKWMYEHPLLFVFKGIRMQWNLYSMERTFFVNLRQGYYGNVPKWMLFIAGPYMGLPFLLLLPLSVIGFVYMRKDNLYLQIILVLFGYFSAIAFMAFMFYRQRYPLLPFLCCFAAYAILKRKEIFADIKSALSDRSAKKRAIIASSLIIFFAVGWLIDIGMSVATLLDTF